MRFQHIPELDGLRGVAVATVIAYHAGYLTGGFLGVTIFFTLSGYLITNILVAEHNTTGTIHLATFYKKRVARLMPAAVTTIILCATLAAYDVGASNFSRDAISSLLYSANWNFVAKGTHYGDALNQPSLLQHFWSLAIEEQFYIIYPIIVYVCLKRNITVLRATVGLLSVASFTVAVVSTPERMYFGTDTRAVEILIGAFTAVTVRSKTPKLVGVIGLSALGWLTATSTHQTLTPVWYTVAAAATAVTITSVTTIKTLKTRPLRTLGKYSYGLYLYHWPMFALLTTQRLGTTGVPLLAVRLGFTLCLTVASFWLIEQPFQRRINNYRHQNRKFLGGSVDTHRTTMLSYR